MDFWLNTVIIFIVGMLTFYIGYRIGFVSGESQFIDEEEEK